MAQGVVWTSAALSDLDEIVECIARDDIQTALSWMDDVLELAESIPSFPGRGRVVPEWREENIRELIHGNYRVIYIAAAEVQIVAVLHSRREFERVFPDSL